MFIVSVNFCSKCFFFQIFTFWFKDHFQISKLFLHPFFILSYIPEYLVSIVLKAFNRLSMEEFSPLVLLSLQLLALFRLLPTLFSDLNLSLCISGPSFEELSLFTTSIFWFFCWNLFTAFTIYQFWMLCIQHTLCLFKSCAKSPSLFDFLTDPSSKRDKCLFLLLTTWKGDDTDVTLLAVMTASTNILDSLDTKGNFKSYPCIVTISFVAPRVYCIFYCSIAFQMEHCYLLKIKFVFSLMY